MDRLKAMETFVRVVDTGSFSRAAKALGLPRSSVTMTMQRLEHHLGVRLLHRNTRQLRLTDEGELYVERCRAILLDVRSAEDSLRPDGRVSGRLRVDMPPSIGRSIILPALRSFRERHPDVEMAIGMTDRLIDLVQEGVDCVIRAGALRDSSLIARRVGSYRWVVCASPDYLARHGEPRDVAALADHVLLGYSSARNGRPDRWMMDEGDVSHAIEPQRGLVVDETFALLDLTVGGFGLTRLSDFLVADHIAQGRLREVLGHCRSDRVPISVLFPPSRQASPPVRAFIDWVTALFASRGS
ncbi:MAG TPA: LysR family transcriptional regulator [Geminicoccus sp.]|uniref:LysR substrate-binding domain-containing protein n=1 Tax=Geminicoccus sp. TaxID=2024832 RepID=UPI002CA12789|nr:LysR family transcriptional regulator [Geminicoccus sp.]HWL71959.1 LysR family transcriptional regulator [Geminicoccus sp.]